MSVSGITVWATGEFLSCSVAVRHYEDNDQVNIEPKWTSTFSKMQKVNVIVYSVSPKIPPAVFRHFFSNGCELLINF